MTSEPSKIKINNLPIERVKTHIFLGIKLHENLSWKEHINSIYNKISKNVGILSRLKSYVPSETLKTIYNSLVMPYLQYGILVWGFECQRLQTLQKKCIRLVTNSYEFEHTEKLFKSLKTLKILDISKYKCLILFHKFKNNSLPTYISNIFSYFSVNNVHSLRFQDNFE